MFHFISVITDIQLNDFKTISKVPYKGNYKWVWNQLRLSADYKVCGVLDLRKVSKSLRGEAHRRDPCQALHPTYLFIFSLSFRPFLLGNRTCCTLATLPTLAALWIFPRSLSWMQGPRKLILWPLSLTGLTEEPKGEMPFFLLKPKLFFIAEPTSSNTPHLPLSSSESPKPNTNTTGKPEQPCHNVPTGKLNSLESFTPEWSLLSNSSKHIAHAHRGLACQTDKCACARTISSFSERNNINNPLPKLRGKDRKLE